MFGGCLPSPKTAAIVGMWCVLIGCTTAFYLPGLAPVSYCEPGLENTEKQNEDTDDPCIVRMYTSYFKCQNIIEIISLPSSRNELKAQLDDS